MSKLIPKSVDNALKNVTDLPTKTVGQTLSDCWFLIFGEITQLADKRRVKYSVELENFKKELEESLATIPEERRTEPSTQMILKTLDEAKYCVEEKDLRALFIKLLTSASDSSKPVHPSFAQIIAQMSPSDALFLKCFKNNAQFPICNIRLKADNDGFHPVAENICSFAPDSLSQHEQTLCISSLIHLGILEIPFGQQFSDSTMYDFVKETLPYKSFKELRMTEKLIIEHQILQLTKLGDLFVFCCIPD